jgi:hypothetical protein
MAYLLECLDFTQTDVCEEILFPGEITNDDHLVVSTFDIPLDGSQILAEFLHQHRFVIGPIAYVHGGNGVVFENDEVSVDAVEEPAVVG